MVKERVYLSKRPFKWIKESQLEKTLRDTGPVIELVHPNAKMPKRATEGSAGLDVYAVEMVHIPAGSWRPVPLGIKIHLPKGIYARLAMRSGLALKDSLDIGAGVIDRDYTGLCSAIIFNHSKHKDFVFQVGDRCAQMIFERISEAIPVQGKVKTTQRGEGGFGSTGLRDKDSVAGRYWS